MYSPQFYYGKSRKAMYLLMLELGEMWKVRKYRGFAPQLVILS